jgi:hypothetical protein
MPRYAWRWAIAEHPPLEVLAVAYDDHVRPGPKSVSPATYWSPPRQLSSRRHCVNEYDHEPAQSTDDQ